MEIGELQLIDYEINKLALISAIELVLMRRGTSHHDLVLAKIQAYYSCEIIDCFEHPEYLLTVLKEVFNKDYDSVLDEINSKTKRLVNMDNLKAHFFKAMII